MPPSEWKGAHLHIDGTSGAAGDMMLGALMDLGVPREVFDRALAAVGLGESRLSVEKIKKGGIAATNVTVRTDESGHGHSHFHHIRSRIAESALATPVKELALDIFTRVARAEAALHKTTIEDVHFHEVGAVDAIADIVGSAAGIAWLEPAFVTASPISVGDGGVKCAHGLLPVPSPAALAILSEATAAIRGGGVERELCTPTGAAIVAATVGQYRDLPAMTPLAIGYGAGDADLPDRPNVLRLILGRPLARQAADAGWDADEQVLVQANLDDMNPEWSERVVTAVFAAGAVDVWWTPIVMKKGRPALEISALVSEADRAQVAEVLVREGTTLGVRHRRVSRQILPRELREVATEYGSIRLKIGRLRGEEVNVAPEYEDCKRAAEAHSVALKTVYWAAIAAHSTAVD